MKNLCLTVLTGFLLVGCDSSPAPPLKPKAIHLLSESEAESLIQQCFGKVNEEQLTFTNKVKGKSEPITRHTDESYRSRVSSRSFQTLDQRLKTFRRYKSLNLNFAFWGSMPNAQGHLYRYVITRDCATNGLEITKVRQSPMIKLAR